MTILVTGFEPFGGETLNPSWEVVKCLPDTIGKARFVRLQVPVSYAECIGKVTDVIDRLSPDAVVMAGQAGGRAELNVERVAINLDDTQAPDNAGVILQGTPIVPRGPAACFVTLPVTEIVMGLRTAGYPAVVSNTAGLFVCNHLMYGVLHHLAVHHKGIPAGFVHVPFVPEQVMERPGTPSMSFDFMTAALQEMLNILVLEFGTQVNHGRPRTPCMR